MEGMIGAFVGIGLSAACGFRVFVPMLGISIASFTGHLELASGFEWIGTPFALIAFSTALILEIGAYYIPWLDNMMDLIVTPSSIIAGTIITASLMGDVHPLLKWSVAAMGGGGSAGVIQWGTVFVRGTSSASTGGFGNPIISTVELVFAVVMTFLAIVIPILTVILVIFLCISILKKFGRLFGRKSYT